MPNFSDLKKLSKQRTKLPRAASTTATATTSTTAAATSTTASIPEPPPPGFVTLIGNIAALLQNYLDEQGQPENDSCTASISCM